MKRSPSSALVLTLGALASVIVACGGDSDTTSTAPGSTAGTGGNAGHAGGVAAGASGTAGKGGSIATGGAAGKAGSGAAGKAGTGGSAGKGGSGVAGKGGSGGSAAGSAGAPPAGSGGSIAVGGSGGADVGGSGGADLGGSGGADIGGSGGADLGGSAGAGGADLCHDGTQDGTETGQDCGGGNCDSCAVGVGCSAPSDCSSGFCNGTVCVETQCQDKSQDGAETATDCGGPVCPACALGATCGGGSDCASQHCVGGVCVDACHDTVQDGTESAVDCGGGTCQKCDVGATCTGPTDCASGFCIGGRCDSDNPTSCLDLFTKHPTTATGPQLIDPDGVAGPIVPFNAYCDLTAGDGGWTLIMKAVNSNFTYDDATWGNATTLNDSSFDFVTDGVAKYATYSTVPFTTIRSSYVNDFTNHEQYDTGATHTSAMALFGAATGIQISAAIPAPLDAYWNGLVNADNQQDPVASGGCLTYIVVGINMKAFLGTTALPGGSFCDWNGGSRYGQRVDAYNQGTGNHEGQGWGSYGTLPASVGQSFAISQLLWVK